MFETYPLNQGREASWVHSILCRALVFGCNPVWLGGGERRELQIGDMLELNLSKPPAEASIFTLRLEKWLAARYGSQMRVFRPGGGRCQVACMLLPHPPTQSAEPKTKSVLLRFGERLRGNRNRGNRPERFWERNLPLRRSLRGSLRGGFSEFFQRVLEVLRGFQRSSQRSSGIFKRFSEVLSDTLSEADFPLKGSQSSRPYSCCPLNFSKMLLALALSLSISLLVKEGLPYGFFLPTRHKLHGKIRHPTSAISGERGGEWVGSHILPIGLAVRTHVLFLLVLKF